MITDEIVYTIDEEDIAGYKKEINGYNITNTHIDTPIPPEIDTGTPGDPEKPSDPGDPSDPGTPNIEPPAVEPPTPDAPTTPEPGTGDNMNMLGFLMALLVSLGVMMLLAHRKKRVL